nr:polyadenylate-binding protein RBP47-like [Tanacetum cinerariifolium]
GVSLIDMCVQTDKEMVSMPGKVKFLSQVSLVHKISVEGIDVAVSDEDLKQLFSQFGEIVSLKIPISKVYQDIDLFNLPTEIVSTA